MKKYLKGMIITLMIGCLAIPIAMSTAFASEAEEVAEETEAALEDQVYTSGYKPDVADLIRIKKGAKAEADTIDGKVDIDRDGVRGGDGDLTQMRYYLVDKVDAFYKTMGITYVLGDDGTYHVGNNKAYDKKAEIEILSVYNDGTNGEKSVKYVDKGAFSSNGKITKVVLPETVTGLGGSAFEVCGNLETVIMPGVTAIDTTNNFLQCKVLKQLVVGDGFTVGKSNFFNHAKPTDTLADISLCVNGTATVSVTNNDSSNNNYLANAKYYYLSDTTADQATQACGTWRFSDKATYEMNVATNHTHGDAYTTVRKCDACWKYNDQGIAYAYDGTTESYYVANDDSCTQEVVTILSKYDDGTHGEAAVTYLASGAFLNNTKITKVVLPENVTGLKGDAFFDCSNLQTVIMPGLTNLVSTDGAGTNNFYNCKKLTTVVVGNGCKINGSQFRDATSDSISSEYSVSIYVNGTTAVTLPTAGTNNGMSKDRIYYNDGTGICGTWKYNDTQDDVVMHLEHNYEDGKCQYCNIYNTQGISYAYDATTQSYYVADNKTYNQETVTILSKYNDGTNGEADVTYITNSAFSANTKITKVIMPTSVTEVKGSAFENCGNLETVIMPGVTVIETANSSGNNKFNGCSSLTKVVVGDGCKITGGQFKGTTGTVYLYVYGTTTASFDSNNPSLNSKIYYYDATGTCGTWKYNDTQDDVIIHPEHNYVDGKCEYCNEYNTQGISYAYDETKACYYVANDDSCTQAVVTILSKYDDGTHGEADVTYITNSAFSANTKITKVIMPTSVTEVKGSAFENCSNLETVIMPGVTVIETANSSGNNKFNGCSSLTKVVVGDGCKITGGQFKGTTGTVYLYVYGTTTASFDSNNPSLNSKIYYYDATGTETGKWTWNDAGDEPIVIQ